MSKEKTIREILAQIRMINERIDMKIIRGRNYKKEAKHHRFLVAQLNRLTRNSTRTPGLHMAPVLSFS